MPRAGVQAKYEALRQRVPSDLQYDDFDWTQKKRLGSGSFGSVSSVPLFDSGVRVAVKKDSRASTYNREVAVLDYITGDRPMAYATQLLGEFRNTLASGEIGLYSVQVCVDSGDFYFRCLNVMANSVLHNVADLQAVARDDCIPAGLRPPWSASRRQHDVQEHCSVGAYTVAERRPSCSSAD